MTTNGWHSHIAPDDAPCSLCNANLLVHNMFRGLVPEKNFPVTYFEDLPAEDLPDPD